jgi:hypothetical protein
MDVTLKRGNCLTEYRDISVYEFFAKDNTAYLKLPTHSLRLYDMSEWGFEYNEEVYKATDTKLTLEY